MINCFIILSYLSSIWISANAVIDFGPLGKPRQVPAGYAYSSTTISPMPKGPNSCGCVPEAQCAPQPGIVGPRETRGISFEFITSNSSRSSSVAGLATSSSSSSSTKIVNKPGFSEYCYKGDVYCCNIIPPKPEPERFPCGVSNVIKVPGYRDIEGQADFGEYPWMAIILSENENFLTSGVLIDQQHVLTVAHGVNQPSEPVFKVRLGDWDLNSRAEPYKFVDALVENIKVHPEFNPLSLQNDIAIIRLSKPIKLNKVDFPHINLACLPKQDYPPGSSFKGKRCWVSGYGKDAFEDGSPSYILKEVQVPVVDGDACQASLRASTLGQYFMLDQSSFICAGGERNKDACTGDGGSALICAGKDGNGYVAGLVSWGIGCARYPAVYVNVPNYIPWIQQGLELPKY